MAATARMGELRRVGPTGLTGKLTVAQPRVRTPRVGAGRVVALKRRVELMRARLEAVWLQAAMQREATVQLEAAVRRLVGPHRQVVHRVGREAVPLGWRDLGRT